MKLALAQAKYSSDSWRQVGAVAVRDGRILLQSHNHHLPSEYSPYVDGDPRDGFSRGVRPDLSTAIHAEAQLVATAAQTGLRLHGAQLYVTTFPCPPCGHLIATAGFSACLYAGPYAMPEGQETLQQAGVTQIWVNTINLSP